MDTDSRATDRSPGTPEVAGSLTRFAWLSIAAAVVTIALKGGAYQITGSVGLLSDALESTVNLAAAVVALFVLKLVARPASDEFSFGFSKAEYFSSGFEGGMILLAAAGIVVSALPRLIEPAPLERLGVGLAISLVATLVNLGVSMLLMRAARRYDSITLEADARHLATDVWTTVGVFVGIGLVLITGWERLDPIIALAVAANILRTGYQLVVRSGRGLLDVSLPSDQQEAVKGVLDAYETRGVRYHGLRTRRSAARSFMAVHVLVPGDWSVTEGHRMAESIESDVRRVVPNIGIVTHVEPVGDEASVADEDVMLD